MNFYNGLSVTAARQDQQSFSLNCCAAAGVSVRVAGCREHTHTHTHARTHAHAHTHARTYMPARTDTRPHARAHAHLTIL